MRLICLLAFVAVLASPALGDEKRPNILFILGDDVTYLDLPTYGGTNIETPNIDRLARGGVRFTRAYCAMSMCAPFRAELYTGLYPVRNGVAYNHSIARPGTRSVVHHLRDLGYRVGLVGKKHASPADTFAFDTIKGPLAGDGVRDYIARGGDQPFCLFVCSHNAHPAWRSGDAEAVAARGVKMPPVLHDNPDTRRTYTAYLAEVELLDKEVGDVLALLEKSGKVDNTLVMFSSEQGWDFAFGKWTNWDIGVHTALIARWPGRIKPGSMTDALVQMADVVPTLVDIAGGDASKLELDGTSFLPVLLGKADRHRKYVYGLHNNVPEGEPYPIRSIRDDRFHMIVNLNHEASYHEKHLMNEGQAKRYDLQWWAALRDAAESGDAQAKRLFERFHKRPPIELYLVDEDPWETKNLANDRRYRNDVKRLRGELAQWMADQNDSGPSIDTKAAYDANRRNKR